VSNDGQLPQKFFSSRNIPYFCQLIAVLTGTVRRSSRRTMIDRCAVSGPSTLFRRGTPGQGAGRSQHLDSWLRSRRERFASPAGRGISKNLK